MMRDQKQREDDSNVYLMDGNEETHSHIYPSLTFSRPHEISSSSWNWHETQ